MSKRHPTSPPPATSAGRERRHYPRLHGIGLMANIAGQMVRVVEVSATGLTLERRFPLSHAPMFLTLYPSDGRHLDLNGGMAAAGIVVHEEDELVGLRFQPATLALVKFVASHMP